MIKQFDIPILFLMFNRPKLAQKVLERIREIKPRKLYVAVDGPRLGRADDREAVAQCQKLVGTIDWPCQVETLFRKDNLGCKQAVSSAIDWFFQNVEYGIILEDDCLPDYTFFGFCEELLIKYKDKAQIMHIGGTNLFDGKKWGEDSYFFSSIVHIWGWATWRRAWQCYDVNMKDYPKFKKSGEIDKLVTYPQSRSYWRNAFDKTYENIIDTWDYQWVFSIWKAHGISIIPNQNLVSNIGFGEGATHTAEKSDFSNLYTSPIQINMLKHPQNILINRDAVYYAFAYFFRSPSWLTRKIKRMKKYLSQIV